MGTGDKVGRVPRDASRGPGEDAQLGSDGMQEDLGTRSRLGRTYTLWGKQGTATLTELER